MFHNEYIRLKNLKQKLIDQLHEQEKVTNQDIYIRDIFIYHLFDKESFGESKKNSNKYLQYGTLSRLIDHIESLANITNEYHKKYYCVKSEEDTYTIKQDCLNKITRALLNEFSLYSSKPLTIDEFSFLLDAIYQIAKNQECNVHLLLSSLSVLTDDNKILNLSLYVQCGKDPKVETFCKGSLSKIDVTYNHPSIFSQEVKPNTSQQARAMSEKSINISEYIASNTGKIISNNTVFYLKTAGGAEYLQAIDVCLDVAYKHTKTLIKKRMNLRERNVYNVRLMSSLKNYPEDVQADMIYLAEDGTYIFRNSKGNMDKGKLNSGTIHLLNGSTVESEIDIQEIKLKNLEQRITENDFTDKVYDIIFDLNCTWFTKPFPKLADHIVTSNCIKVLENEKITDVTVHIDPENDRATSMINDIVTVSDLMKSIKNKYSKMSINKYNDGFVVCNPPFGSSYKVVPTEERKLGGYSNDLKGPINNWNKKTKKHIINFKLGRVIKGKEFNMLMDPVANKNTQIILVHK